MRLSQSILCSWFAFAAAALGLATSARAQFLNGQTLTLRNIYQGVELSQFNRTFVVDSTPGAVEVACWALRCDLSIDLFDIDATHARAVITGNTIVGFGPSPNLALFDYPTATVSPLVGVSLGGFDWPGVDASRVAFNAQSFSFDLGDLNDAPGRFVVLEIVAVPEPSFGVLLVGGVLAFAALKWFRNKAAR